MTSEESEDYILDGSGEIVVNVSDRFTLIKKSKSVPKTFTLYQNYPNPFNPITTIKFDIPSVQTRGNASLRIYDSTGRLIEILIDEELEPGNHTVQWNATGFSSGVYFVRLQSGNYLQTQKILLMK